MGTDPLLECSLIAAKQQPEGHGGTRAVTYRPVDFAAIARAAGMHGVAVDDVAGFECELAAALERPGPVLLDVTIDPSGYGAVLDAIRGSREPRADDSSSGWSPVTAG